MRIRTLEEAVAELKRDPARPVQVRVDDLTVELRAVGTNERSVKQKSAADVFAQIGPWEGESLDELLSFFSKARAQGGSRNVPEL
jgi:hypothetical protein